MKILFFIESLHSGGKERRLVELIKGLTRFPDVEMEIVLTKKGINYNDIFDVNIKIHYLIREKSRDPRIFLRFFKIANKFKPDYIHVWGRMVAIYAIPTKIILKIPMINNEIADAPPNILPAELSLKISFLFSDMLIANSHAGIKAYNAPLNNSTVIYNGFDFDRIKNLENKREIKDKFNINTEHIVGMVASFYKNKDYNTYIEAAKLILKTHKNITFLCIGDLMDFKISLDKDIENKILFLGRQKNIESIMNICDIGVLTSNVDVHGEGISNALMEFMALGKPVIANDCGGNTELIINEESGFIIGSKDSLDLKDKILLLLKDKNLMSKFGRKSKNIVIEKFNINNMIESFKLIYDKNK